ncbi:6020_t:CDS:2, partial [Dentiscutata erythropus]
MPIVMSNNYLVPNNNPILEEAAILSNKIVEFVAIEETIIKSNKDDLVKEVVKITSNYNIQDENYIDSIELGPEKEDD